MRIVGFLIVIAMASVSAQRTDTIIRAAGRPVHSGVAEPARDLAVGVADGDENYMIGAINDIAVAANGTMYVLDRSVPAVRVYDAKGKFVKNIGRRGSGPGEYGFATAIAIASNGNLLLYDQGNARINVYSPSGDVITSWPTRGGTGSGSGRGFLISDALGTTYVRAPIWRPGQSSQPRWAWFRFAADGALRDTVYGPDGPSAPVLSAQQGGFSKSANVPFAPAYYTEVSPLGYFVTSQSSRIAIDLHEPGKPVASVRRDIELQAVTRRERDSARTEVSESMRQTDPSWSWNGPDIPAKKAAFTGLRLGADGLLWVQLSKGPRIDDGSSGGPGGGGSRMGVGKAPPGGGRGSTWSCPTDSWTVNDVYEPSGRYLGQVKLPERVSVLHMRGDYLWAATCNEDDVPQVVRYRIDWR